MAAGLDRVRALVIGPGLGPGGRRRRPGVVGGPAARVSSVPAVVDADGLTALADLDSVAAVAGPAGAAVLTPHDGEYARLVGHPPGEDRIADVRPWRPGPAQWCSSKGSPTIVAGPRRPGSDGRLRHGPIGDGRFGRRAVGGDRGVPGPGLPALEAAALGAHCHGRAAALGRAEGLVAGDLPDLVSDWLSGTIRDLVAVRRTEP